MEIYLKAIVEPILLNPTFMKIGKTEDDRGTLLTIGVHKLDMGRVIGKSGDTIKSIRTLMHNYGSINQCNVSVKVSEPLLE